MTDKSKLYTSIHDFFILGGDVNMRLSRETAIELCESAIDYDILIWKIEGGIFHNPKFEARLDAIWDGVDPPISKEEAIENNNFAVKFLINYMPVECNACLLTIANYQTLSDEHLYDKYFEKHSISS